MRASRLLPVALFVWGVGIATAFAVSADDVARALAAAKNDPNPPAAFWRAVRAMPDFTLSGDDVRRAVNAQGDGVVDPVLASLLARTQTFSKTGDQVSLDQSRASLNPTADDNFRSGSTVTFRIADAENNGVKLDGIQGVQFNPQNGTLPSVEDVTFQSQNGRPMMNVGARLGDQRRELPVDLTTFGVRPGRGFVGALDRQAPVATTSSQSQAPVATTDSSATTTAPVTSSSNDIAPNASSTVYTIEMGDTLWDIAQAYGITVDQLLDYDGGTGVKNSERLRQTAPARTRHRGDPDWIWHPQQITLPRRENAPTPRRHNWGR